MRRRYLSLPQVLQPQDIVCVVDTREQAPLALTPFPTVTRTLPTGDYSVRHLEHMICCERKSLPDLLQCVTRERERFEKELARMPSYPSRCVVVEASWRDLQAGEWRSMVTPKAVWSSVVSWTARYAVPFLLVGDRQGAADAVRGFLWHSARHALSGLRGFAQGLHGANLGQELLVTTTTS